MKKLLFPTLILCALTITAFVVPAEEYKTLSIGDAAPMVDTKMDDVSGKQFSLSELKKTNGMLVVFSCNTCPFVVAWEDRYPALAAKCEKNNIGMVLVNSNEAKRSGEDSMAEMTKHAKDFKYGCPYVVDNNSALANAFGAKTTPHVFLFDADMKLVYKGAIDDNYKDAHAVEEHYVDDAIDAIANDEEINPSDTKAVGCSIKRVIKE